MKKVTRYAFALGVIFSSCQKEESIGNQRNYVYDYPECASSSFVQFTGESDDDFVVRIRKARGFSSDEAIYLSPDYYNGDVISPDPEYMLFPLAVSSMNSEWGWERVKEYNELGEQEFCNKYFNGEKTAGMKLK